MQIIVNTLKKASGERLWKIPALLGFSVFDVKDIYLDMTGLVYSMRTQD